MSDAMRDPLNNRQPHTPDKPFRSDANRPTCSAPSEHNKGCSSHHHCALSALRADNSGPTVLVLEEASGSQSVEGRRFPVWCFEAYRKFFGAEPKSGYSVCEDRALPVLNGTEWSVSVLKPYGAQGPFPFPLEAASPEGAQAAMAAHRAAQVKAKNANQITPRA